MYLQFFLIIIMFTANSDQSNITEDIFTLMMIPNYFASEIETAVLYKSGVQYSPLCAQQLLEYVRGLTAFKQWALNMFDASGKITSGILEGNTDMGSFDECLNVQSPNKSVIGQYCIGEINVDIKALMHPTLSKGYSENTKTIFSRFESSGYPMKEFVCVPDGCSSEDLTALYGAIGLDVIFSKDDCQTKNTRPKLDSNAVISMSFFGTILMAVLIFTLYDTYFYYKCRETPYLVITAFSVVSNVKKLLARSQNPDVISCLHGMRSLSIMWVILGHTYSRQMRHPVKNLAFVMKWMFDASNMFIMGATISVDTFLLISGLAISYGYLIYISKGYKFNLLLFYVHRYLRLTPALAVVILFYVTLLKYIGNGPFWPSIASSVADRCINNWWRSLLYIQNYGVMDACMSQTWYLTVDTQLYIVSPIILLPLSKWPKKTYIGTAILTIIAIGWGFWLGLKYDFNGQFVGNILPIDYPPYFKQFYSATHSRASVWLIGILYGYLLFEVRNNKPNLSAYKVWILFSWLIALGVLFTCIYGGHGLIFRIKGTDTFKNLLHFALLRPSWATALGFMIFACFAGYGGPINWFLSLPVFEILGKLSYAMYLVHYIVVYIQIGKLRTAIVFDNYDEMYMYWGNYIVTIFVALILYLGFEYPTAVLEHALLRKIRDYSNKEINDDGTSKPV